MAIPFDFNPPVHSQNRLHASPLDSVSAVKHAGVIPTPIIAIAVAPSTDAVTRGHVPQPGAKNSYVKELPRIAESKYDAKFSGLSVQTNK